MKEGGKQVKLSLDESPSDTLTDAPSHKYSIRYRVYRLLIEGQPMASVARILKKSRQTIAWHVAAMEESRVLTRAKPGMNPILFIKGPTAPTFEGEACQSQMNRAHRPPIHSDTPLRVHGGGYSWAIVSGPMQAPSWSKSWVAKGVVMASGKFPFRGGSFRIVEVRGKDSRVLRVWPPETLLWDARAVATAGRSVLEEAADAARSFAREYGYTLQGRLVEDQAVEFGIAVPGLAKTGAAGQGPVWVDTSPGRGQSEVETSSPAIAASIADLPRWTRVMEERVTRVHEELQAHREVMGKVLGLQEEAAAAQRLLVTAVVPTPTSPKDPGPGPEVV